MTLLGITGSSAGLRCRGDELVQVGLVGVLLVELWGGAGLLPSSHPLHGVVVVLRCCLFVACPVGAGGRGSSPKSSTCPVILAVGDGCLGGVGRMLSLVCLDEGTWCPVPSPCSRAIPQVPDSSLKRFCLLGCRPGCPGVDGQVIRWNMVFHPMCTVPRGR